MTPDETDLTSEVATVICKKCGKPADRNELATVKCSRCGNKKFGLGVDPRIQLPVAPTRSQPL